MRNIYMNSMHIVKKKDEKKTKKNFIKWKNKRGMYTRKNHHCEDEKI